MQISLDVFSKKMHTGTMSIRTFYGLISIFIASGLLTTFLVAGHLVSIGYQMTSWFEIILCLAVCILGIFIVHSTDNLIISLIGYAMIAIPLAFPLAGQLGASTATAIVNAGILTAIITGIMGFLGVTFPNVFSKLGSALFFSLLALIGLRLLSIFIPAINSFGILEYIGAGIFSLYIGYDMWRASTVDRTFKNALDISINLYLDILNLFTHLLAIMGNDD
jgi:FtsH-binding integral membrane protein